MDISINSNYQIGFGMRQSLKSPEVIQRKAKQTYQHLSPYILQRKYGSQTKGTFIETLQKSLAEFRYNLETRENPKALIEHLKNGPKTGNGGEEAMLATVIGQMNGQKNIYTGNVNGLDHAISFITNSNVKNDQEMVLRGKNAIIIDPQLGITDYANNYFPKLCKISGTSKKQNTFIITPVHNHGLSEAQIADLRTNYPELLIEKYKAPM